MTIKDIISICDGKLLCGKKSVRFNKFSKDTRTISNTDIYVAIKGSNFDGNDYVVDAYNKGVKCALVDKIIDVTHLKDMSVVYVKDTVYALSLLASYKRNKFNGPVVAITGSVGKTTTKDLLIKVLSTKYKVLGTIGNNNNNIGLPFTILNGDNADVWVLEMGMNNPGEISYLSNIARPTISVITTIGSSHIGNLGSRENILKAKLEILDGMDNKVLFINNDNDLLHKYSKTNKCITVGIDNKSDYNYKCIKNKHLINNKEVILFSYENAHILDSLLVYAVSEYLRIPFKNIIESLSNFQSNGSRLKLVENNKNITIIDDSYNASYDSVKLSISILSKYNKRKIYVFGDILELGNYSEKIHNDIGKLFIKSNIDIVVCVGKYSKNTYNILKNKQESYYFENSSDVSKFLNKIINENDVILFKASNAMKLKETIEVIKK